MIALRIIIALAGSIGVNVWMANLAASGTHGSPALLVFAGVAVSVVLIATVASTLPSR